MHWLNRFYEIDDTTPLADDHVLTQFLMHMSTKSYLAYQMKMQQMLTIYIVTGEISMEILEEMVRFIDLLWRVNKLRPEEEQLQTKDFHNDAINN